MKSGKCKVQTAKSERGARSCRQSFSIFHFPLSTFHSRAAFTLIEMLVVMAIIATLAGMLTGVILYARNLSIRVQCQQNLHQIGEAVSVLVLNNNGLCPIGPPVSSAYPSSGLSNAYPKPQASDNATPNMLPNNSGFPWWARVFEQWDVDMGELFAKDPATGLYLTPTTAETDPSLNPNMVANLTLPSEGHVLNPQLPRAMQAFHCRMAGELDGSPTNHLNPSDPNNWSVINLFNSISYGINFDVKDANNSPYCSYSAWSSSVSYIPGAVVSYNGAFYNCIAANSNCQPSTNTGDWQVTSCSPDFPNNLSTADMDPDQYSSTEIQNPGQFILISEANTQGQEWIPAPSSHQSPTLGIPPWTGGRISMGAIDRTHPTDASNVASPPYNAPIVARHSGFANVLFADWHVEAIQIIPGQTSATANINYNTPFWTLPGK